MAPFERLVSTHREIATETAVEAHADYVAIAHYPCNRSD
jgi:hypothetical protein